LGRKAVKITIIPEKQSVVKEDVGTDAMAKNLDGIRSGQKAFISGLRRVEKRLDILENKVG